MEGNSFAMPSCEEIVEDDSGSEYLELEIQSKSSMEKENRNNEKETRKKSKSRKSTGRRVRKIAKEEES